MHQALTAINFKSARLLSARTGRNSGARKLRCRRCARIERCGDKDGARPGEIGRWQRRVRRYPLEVQNCWRSCIAMVGLVKQLTFGRSVTGKQRMHPVARRAIRRGCPLLGLGRQSPWRRTAISICSRYVCNMANGLLTRGADRRSHGWGKPCRMHCPVHLTQCGAQHHGQCQHGSQPVGIPAIHAHAPLSQCGAMVLCASEPSGQGTNPEG